MSKQIIEALPKFRRMVPCIEGTEDPISKDQYLQIAEFFYDTIQGEGVNMGIPATFLRLQNCSQSCVFCDTTEVWRFGNPYTFPDLYDLMIQHDTIRRLEKGQHLVLTGGSPILQQSALINFIHGFIAKFNFKPYIEIENECTIMPDELMFDLVDCWNNSPKLANSFNPQAFRFQPQILIKLSDQFNSWFKFVISHEDDWEEISTFFLEPGYIRRDQVVLMPMGATRAELFENREMVIALAIRENVRYSTREHIVVWDKKTGI